MIHLKIYFQLSVFFIPVNICQCKGIFFLSIGEGIVLPNENVSFIPQGQNLTILPAVLRRFRGVGQNGIQQQRIDRPDASPRQLG